MQSTKNNYWLLLTGCWLFYLVRCSIPDAEGITFFRRVGNQSPNHTASHRCKNLKSGTVGCISHTWEEVLNSQQLHSAKQAKFISVILFSGVNGAQTAEQNQTSATGNT
jgi:hypothetical protein